MLVELQGWRAVSKALGDYATSTPRALDAAVRDEAFYFQGLVVKQFRTQGGGAWKPIGPITEALRKHGGQIGRAGGGGTKALVATGSLRKSIQTHKERLAHYFVGAHRTAGGPPGSKKSYADIAAMNETGVRIIPITAKMRAFFMYLFFKGIIPYPWPPATKRFIIIKRRSFLKTAMDEFQPGHKERTIRRFAAHLAGRGSIKV